MDPSNFKKSQQLNTITKIIDSIQFPKSKGQNKYNKLQTSSLSGSLSQQNKQTAKSWTAQQLSLFKQLLQNLGTDFSSIKSFFPRKSKNQLKNKYKQLLDQPKVKYNFQNPNHNHQQK